MSENDRTMELGNPYDQLIETTIENTQPAVVFSQMQESAQVAKVEKAVEIIPLASNAIYNQLRTNERRNSYTAWVEVEEDLLVPDTEPDMEAIFNVTGCITTINISGDTGEVKGEVSLETMYHPADRYNDAIIVISANVPFKKEVTAGSNLSVQGSIKQIEYRIINERKYRIKIHMELCVWETVTIERSLFQGIQEENLQTLCENVRFVNAGTKKYRENDISEILYINDEKIRPIKILKSQFVAAENHRQFTSEKLIINSTIWVRILYMAELASKGNLSNQPMLFQGKIDHTQFILLGNEDAEASACTIHTDVHQLRAEINDEANGFVVSGECGAEVQLFSFIEKEIVSDCFHEKEDMTFDSNEEVVCCSMSTEVAQQAVRETIDLQQEGGENPRVVYMDARILESKVEVVGTSARVEGQMQLEVVTMNDDDNAVLAKKVCDFSCMSDVNGTASIDSIFVREMSADIINQNQISITAQLQAQLNVCEETQVKFIANPCIIRSEEPVRTYPINIYTVKKNDRLWDIAKRFKVPEEYITKINSPENIQEGKKIVIVK